MTTAETELVRAAQGGDETAFAVLVERHWNRLVCFARTLVGDGEAEDLAQEAFLVAWRKLAELRSAEAFGAWMMRVLSRLCWRRLRGRRESVALELVDEPRDHSVSTRSLLDVEKLLALLAPRQRAVMHLTVVEGMSDREIGEVLAIDSGSVRAHRRRAREKLRRVLAPIGG